MLSWLEFYNWVLGPDGPSPKPPDHVLEDDEALDAYIEKWKQDITNPSDKNRKRIEFNG